MNGLDLGGYAGFGTPRPPTPLPGQDPDFDAHVLNVYGDDIDDGGDEEELRRAAWATWQAPEPTAMNGNGGRGDESDDELQRALAMSRESFAESGDIDRPIDLADDVDDEDLKRAIAASEEEARAPKRQRREETPDEERKQLEAALAASLEAGEESGPSGTSSTPLARMTSDDAIEIANREYQKQREADREKQRRERELKNGSRSGTNTPRGPGSPKQASGSQINGSTTVTSSIRPVSRAAPGAAEGVHVPSGNPSLKPGGLAYDRAQMEKERLARQKAREQPGSSAGQDEGAGRVARTVMGTVTPIAGPSRITTNAGPSSSSASSSVYMPSGLHPFQRSGPFPTDAAGEYYLDGELRHTDLQICKPTSTPTFNLPSIIGKKSEISFLILNSFVLDDQWLDTLLPTPDVCPQILIRPHPKDKPDWNGKCQAQEGGDVFVYPKMMGDWGSAHMKFLWIWYKTGRLRVVVSTANFVTYDWDSIENTVFVQDFLPLRDPEPLDPSRLAHDLPCQFRFLFTHLKVHKGLKFLIEKHPAGREIPFSPTGAFEDLAKYDWSRSKVKVVMSIPGIYDGYEEMQKFGLCRLGRVLKEEGWVPKKDEVVAAEYQYGWDWWQNFYGFLSGKTIQQVQISSKPKEYSNIKVLYPSLATVDASELGRDGGGTMFVGKSWTSGTKKLFYDANSKRGGALMHAKASFLSPSSDWKAQLTQQVLVAQYEPRGRALGFEAQSDSSPEKGKKRKADEMEDKEPVGGWVYVGSHNFSSAAWGTMNLKKPIASLTIRNYELGIVFPLPSGQARQVADAIVPYKRPPRPYGPMDVPWDQKQHRSDQE